MPNGKVPDDPSKTRYRLISGDCFIDGFEGGNGDEIGVALASTLLAVGTEVVPTSKNR